MYNTTIAIIACIVIFISGLLMGRQTAKPVLSWEQRVKEKSWTDQENFDYFNWKCGQAQTQYYRCLGKEGIYSDSLIYYEAEYQSYYSELNRFYYHLFPKENSK